MIYLKFLLLCGWLTLVGFAVFAQESASGSVQIRNAYLLFLERDYKQSAKEYFIAFAQNDLNRTDQNLFTAAKACAQGNYRDSAFKYLQLIADRRNRKYFKEILYNSDLKKLSHSKQWQNLEALIELESRQVFNQSIATDLLSIYKERQRADRRHDELLLCYGSDSENLKLFRDSMIIVDSVNDFKLKSIIDTYGWPGPEEIGAEGVTALAYLFRYARYSTQKHYFPLVVDAYKSGTINPYNYAIIADRLSLESIGKQLYGTQPGRKIATPDSLNLRRRAIGLDTLAMP